jgi:flagellar biosynthesis/type III secretory pathway M-ring protein FliF/YscJ
MKLKWRNLPAIVTLLAGFVTCIITIRSGYALNTMLWTLIVVMLVFYVASLVIRAVLVHFFKEKAEDEEAAEGDEDIDGEPLDGEEPEGGEAAAGYGEDGQKLA